MDTPAIRPVTIRLEDLIAINREIAALVRAGVPLELGLRTFAGGLPSRLGRLADRIANRLNQGESATRAFQLEGLPVSPVYSAVIDAGLQSGRVPEVLEAVAKSAEVLQETRRQLQLALVYPIVVCLLGYALFVFFITALVPNYIRTAEDFGFSDDVMFRTLRQIHDTKSVWIWVVPLVAFGIMLVSRFWLRQRGLFRSFTMGQILARAQFADLLQIQIAQGLPIGPSFRRAADATGDRRLRRLADDVCRDLERGIPFEDAVAQSPALPPMMRWMLSTGAKQGTFVKSLELVRDSFRRQALRQSQVLRVWLPAVFTLVIAGGFALMYALLFFLPLRGLWEGIMRE
ncbi:MAG: type secretory pathway, component PulF [Schlesneria sp.]|nr:type secretory pathway, component PulF [Schlesneria sp.]